MDRRIEKTLIKARAAALDVLAAGGFSDFTMEAVSEHSGISKSTLYRHWPDRINLLADALETLNQQPRPAAPLKANELRERVIELITHLASALDGSRIASVMPALIEAAEHHEQVASFLHGYSAARRKTLVKLLQQGVARGDLPAEFNAELASLALSGPIFYCRLMSPAAFPKKRVAALVDLVLGSRCN
ncbi:TetR family transcriptional regulator [bacterium]|nr:TetR family transcriptional regulator [bacterium]